MGCLGSNVTVNDTTRDSDYGNLNLKRQLEFTKRIELGSTSDGFTTLADAFYTRLIALRTKPLTMSSSRTQLFSLFFLLVTFLSYPIPSQAIKFELPAAHFPVERCIWNTAHKNALIIITANVGPGNGQRVDVEVRDRDGGAGNVYLSKRDIKGETRLAVTAHAEGDVGVCFKNRLDSCEFF